jgi:hypothetical protein
MRQFITGLMVASVTLTLVMPALANNLILQVPDWNQPNPAEYPGDNLPAPVGGVDAYPGWCAPTAGGNIMGYWEDVKGCVGLTDRKKFNLTTAYPNTPATWEQGLYHDGIIEMGWKMNTGGWQTFNGPFPSYHPGGTLLGGPIMNGLLTYATTGWTDNDYPVAGGGGTGIVKRAFPQTAGFPQFAPNVVAAGDPGTPLAAMWTTYTGQVDLAHPVEMSFDRWVSNDTGNTVIVNGQTVHKWTWALMPSSEEGGHSVVGVGYIDPTPSLLNGDEWIIAQDGWSSTQQYVAVTLDYPKWKENDYITNVPEPASVVPLLAGTASLLLYGWYRRGTA